MKLTVKEPQSITFEEFEALPLEERLLILPLLSPKKRFDFLTDSKDALTLVRSSPVLDLMVTIKEIGIDGSGALLSLLSDEQMQYVLDIDSWNGYTFNKEKMHRYLMVLREWDVDAMVEKFRGLDYEQQLIYMLGDFKVFLSGEDFRIDEEIPENTFTIDGVYYLRPLCDEEKSLLTKELLTLIFSIDMNLYLRLVEGMRQELYSQLEEDLYRFRSSRITELGFYEYEDAIGVYSPPTGIKRNIISPNIDPFIYSRLPVRYITDLDIARSELELIDDRLALEILFELQVLINRIIVADKLEMFEIESVEEASSKVKSLLRLGLDTMKKELNITPPEAIKRYYVIDIFRYGYKKIKFLCDEARRIRSLHQYLKYIELPSYFETLINIASRPFGDLDMQEIFSDAKSQYPESLVEVDKMYELLLEIEASLDIIIKCFEVSTSDVEGLDKRSTNIPFEARPTLYNLLITPVANLTLGYGPKFIPVKYSDIERLCKITFLKSGEEVFLTDEFLRLLEERIFSLLKDSERYQYARRIMGRALEEYISELGSINDFSSLKPEFISVLTIKNNN